MKFFQFILFLFSVNLYSQSNFIKGYFIDNRGNRLECLINDSFWDLNPSQIEYKLDSDSKTEVIDISQMKEYGDNSEYKFIRYEVMIDEFRTGKIGTDKDLYYVKKNVFLRELVSGKANLYSYNDSGSMKFFFSMNGSDTPVQLEYKLYSFEGVISQNNNYKQQLFNNLKGENISQSAFEELEYKSKSLINLFLNYNSQNATGKNNKSLFKKTIDFNLWLKGGYQQMSFTANSNNDFIGDFDFGTKSQIRAGIEFEMIMPSRGKNNFSFFIELSRLSYKGSAIKPYGDVNMEYSVIEAPIGVKYYVGLSKNTRVFLSTSLQGGFVTKAKFKMDSFSDVYGDFKGTFGFGFGAGIVFKKKFLLSVCTISDRDVMNNQFSSNFKSAYAYIGYNVF